jgi:uncharacterized Zn-finger protein
MILLREPLEQDSTHFTPFELSFLEVAVPETRLPNREHSPISPSILLSTYSLNNTQDYPETELAASIERPQLRFDLHSQSKTPPRPTVSPYTMNVDPVHENEKEESLESSELHLAMRFRSYSPSLSAGKTNRQYNPMADEKHSKPKGTKPLACDECDKRFGNKKNLARHLKLHRNERNYVCTVCNRRFNRADYLKKHLSSLHQGVKPEEPAFQ